jgi:hypothetical protein
MFGFFNYVVALIMGVPSPLLNLCQCATAAGAIMQLPIYHAVVTTRCYDFRRRAVFLRDHHGVRSELL